MIVDTSALVALILQEPSAEAVERSLVDAGLVGIGAPTLVEAGMVLLSRAGSSGTDALGAVLAHYEIAPVSFDDRHHRLAMSAFSQFGKGRHPAGLNMGDCFSYASARRAARPLLCIGNDFPQTDLELVPLP